ncbi:hypothetical protein CH35J_004512 [Colletotrichum higginsianum]|uniref:Rhodopsin domain-containing protein n=1 Tax=Colletotrichum higginsianum TaxID=80884 RepID=A0A4T0WAJ5_9PEZI|nr:hypothetical protein CH35J_004512 [Colletotrichum higginsianum]
MALGVLWGLTGLTLCFVLLRLYTRLVILQAYGIDDHFYNFAFILFVAYDVMLTISSYYGFGRNVMEIETPDVPPAILYEAIGTTILVSAIVVSKASLALFLLRLVNTRLHQIVVLGPVIILFLFAVVSLLVFWFSCVPIEFLWNRFIPGGVCHIDPGPISTAAGSWSVVVDFCNPGPYTRNLTGSNGGFGLRTIGGTDYTVRVGMKTPELDLSSAAGRSGGGIVGVPAKPIGKAYGDDNSVDSILGPEDRHGHARGVDTDGYSSEEGKSGAQNIWVKSEVLVKSTARD